MSAFTGVQVFSATKHLDRAELGEQITRWLVDNPAVEVVDKIVTQSSDSEYHCIAITLFYNGVANVSPRPFPGSVRR